MYISKQNVFKEKIQSGKFVITAEISSPKGINTTNLLSKVSEIKEFTDAINICDCPMANMRMSSIVLAHLLQKQTGITAIPHISCRDRNIIGIQSELLGACTLGVNNLLAITGDGPEKGDHPNSTGVFEVNSPGLIGIIQNLNNGTDFSGNELDGCTDFFIGATANPNAQDLESEIEKLAEKVQKGAAFIQTQPVFDANIINSFVEKTSFINVPILMGLMPLKSYKMALNFKNKLGIDIPEHIILRMEKDPKEGVKIAAEIAEDVKDIVQGIHIMPLGKLDAVKKISMFLRGLHEVS